MSPANVTTDYKPAGGNFTVLTPSDTLVYAEIGAERVQVWLDTLAGMTISTDIGMSPVWNLGKKKLAGHTTGSIIIAGTLLFPKTSSASFEQMLIAHSDGSGFEHDRLSKVKPMVTTGYIEKALPFDIITISLSELGKSASATILKNVKIMQSDEQGQSGNFEIIAYKYMARDIWRRTLTPGEFSFSSKNERSSYLRNRIRKLVGGLSD